MTLRKRGWLGAYVKSILFANTLDWGSGRCFQKVRDWTFRVGELVLLYHSFLALPVKGEKKKAFNQTKSKWAWQCANQNFISGKQKFEFHRISHVTK